MVVVGFDFAGRGGDPISAFAEFLFVFGGGGLQSGKGFDFFTGFVSDAARIGSGLAFAKWRDFHCTG